MKCWICCDNVNCPYLLPEQDETFIIPKDKKTFKILSVPPFTFLYYTVCLECLENYISHYPFFKNIHSRETIRR